MSVLPNIYQELKTRSPVKIAIVRALPGLGDFLCTVPAFRALRTAFPEAHITLIGLSSTRELVRRFDNYLDDWLAFPGFPGIPEVTFSPQRTAFFLEQVQALQFDLVLQMHGNGSCINPFILQFEAKFSAGFAVSEQASLRTNGFLSYPEQEPEVWRLLHLLNSLDIPLQGTHLEFPLKSAD